MKLITAMKLISEMNQCNQVSAIKSVQSSQCNQVSAMKSVQ